MYSARRMHCRSLCRRSEKGFVLIAALMAVMILVAVGFFILTTTTQDITISSRLVGERKALSAAEAGVQQLCIEFNLGMAATPYKSFDSTDDPTAQYQIAEPDHYTDVPTLPAYGWDEAMEYGVFSSVVTGRDTAYKSEVQLSVGVKSGPYPLGTEYE